MVPNAHAEGPVLQPDLVRHAMHDLESLHCTWCDQHLAHCARPCSHSRLLPDRDHLRSAEMVTVATSNHSSFQRPRGYKDARAESALEVEKIRFAQLAAELRQPATRLLPDPESHNCRRSSGSGWNAS